MILGKRTGAMGMVPGATGLMGMGDGMPTTENPADTHEGHPGLAAYATVSNLAIAGGALGYLWKRKASAAAVGVVTGGLLSIVVDALVKRPYGVWWAA